LRWYFVERLQGAVPTSLEDYAKSAGFEDIRSMRKAILRDYLTRDVAP